MRRHASLEKRDLGEGSWGSAAIGNGEDTSPEAKKATEDIDGCWAETVHDKFDKEGTAFFFFDQDGTVLETDSEFEFEWPHSSFAESPTIAKDSVNSKGFKMSSPNLPPGKCTATISGGLKNGVLKGKAKFHARCAKLFKNVTFSVTPESCI